MSVLMLFVLLVISLVFSAHIANPLALDVVTSCSTKVERSLSFPAIDVIDVIDVIGKSKIGDVPTSNADGAYMIFQCIRHNPLQEDVEKCRGKQTSLSYSNGCT